MTTLRFSASDGVTLVASAFGAPDGLPVLFLHGGGQTRHAWSATARAVAQRGAYALSLDLRGHGESGWAPDGRYEADTLVADVEKVLRGFARPAALVGASLGGMLALLAAAHDAEPVRALALVDIALRSEEKGVERILRFMAGGSAGFATVDEAADAVAAYLPHRDRPDSVDGLKKNLRLGADGRYYWHWDPAMLSHSNIGAVRRSGRLMEAARALTMPVLLVRGGASDVVTEEIAREFVTAVPHAACVDVGGARHMVAGDANDAFTAAIVDFVFASEPA